VRWNIHGPHCSVCGAPLVLAVEASCYLSRRRQLYGRIPKTCKDVTRYHQYRVRRPR
jgi:hypothetical protein